MLLLPGAAIAGAAGAAAGGAGGGRRDRRVSGHLVGAARQYRRCAGHRCAARTGPRLPVGGARRRPGADSAGAGGVVPGVVAQRRTGVRRRRVHTVPATGAGHLVAGADRRGGGLRPDRRRLAVRDRGDPGRDRRASARTPRRLGRGAGGLPRGPHACRSRSWRWWRSSRLTPSTAPGDVGTDLRPHARAGAPRHGGSGTGPELADDETRTAGASTVHRTSRPLTARIRGFGVSTFAKAGYVTCSLNRLTAVIQN